MPSVHERQQQEAKARRWMRARLGPLVALTHQLNSIYDRVINAIADHPRSGSAAKVGLILTTRLANDLRVCTLTSQSGYGLQALVLAGTVVEVVGSMSYVGESDDRAVSWAKQTDRRRTYPPRVADGIDATLTALGFSEPAARDNWKEAYSLMCMAKHANPFLSLLHGLRILPTGAHFVYGPDVSDLGAALSAQALWHSVGFGGAGAFVAAAHCADEQLQTQLRTEAARISQRLKGLEPWFLEVIGPESPLKIQKEASALLVEARRLQSETERLRRETQRVQRQTRRLRRVSEIHKNP